MRTTIRLDPDLMHQLKRLAAETHRTLTSVIEDSLREMLARRKSASPRKRVKIPTFGTGGLCPGVNLDSTVDLLDRMEGH